MTRLYLKLPSAAAAENIVARFRLLLRALPRPPMGRRLFVPSGTDAARRAALRSEGWITVAGLDDVSDQQAEAHRLGCTHWLQDGHPAALDHV